MKKIIFTAVLLLSAFSAYSQVVDRHQSVVNSGASGFSSIYLVYSPAKYYGKNSDSDPFNKFAVGWDNASLVVGK